MRRFLLHFVAVYCMLDTIQATSSYEVVETVIEGRTKLNVIRSTVEFDIGGVPLLFLLSDQSIIGGHFDELENRDQAIFPGFAIMQASRYLDRKLHRAIQIGLGVGTVPTFLRRHGIATDVVEISQGVVDLATKYFGYERCIQGTDTSRCKHGKTVVADGLEYLRTRAPVEPSYELVIVDVYTGYNVVPFYTEETLLLIQESWLKEKGVLVMNFVGFYNGPHLKLVQALAMTLRSVFQHVRCFLEMPYNEKEEAANIVFYASNAPITFTLPSAMTSDTPMEVLSEFQDWEMLQVEDASIEVSLDHDEYSNDINVDAYKQGVDPSRVLHDTSDFDIHRETLDATETYMRNFCIDQFPAEMWKEIGF